MAGTIISAKYPPQIDPTRTPLAFEDRALPRINRELRNDNLLTRQRAVMSLCDYLHDPEHIASALREEIAESLKLLLKDDDPTIRQKSTESLYVIAGHAIGRDAFLEKGIILPLADLFDDDKDIVRKNSHKAIEMLSETPIGAEAIVEAKLVPKLVLKLKSELDEIKVLILDTLHFCMIVSTDDALKNQAMEVFTELLSHEAPQIRAKASRNIYDLSMTLGGKDKAVEVQCMHTLVKLLSDPDFLVRASAASAIMIISVTTKGKYTALEAGAIESLVKLVDDSVSEIRVNSLKALTCLSEAPEGRKQLLNHVEQIRERINDEIPAVVKAATIALKVITWKP